MIIYNDPHKEVVVNATVHRNGVDVGVLCDGVWG
jgi:hypothetical protein